MISDNIKDFISNFSTSKKANSITEDDFQRMRLASIYYIMNTKKNRYAKYKPQDYEFIHIIHPDNTYYCMFILICNEKKSKLFFVYCKDIMKFVELPQINNNKDDKENFYNLGNGSYQQIIRLTNLIIKNQNFENIKGQPI